VQASQVAVLGMPLQPRAPEEDALPAASRWKGLEYDRLDGVIDDLHINKRLRAAHAQIVANACVTRGLVSGDPHR
jgi:hypothetical protein